MLSSYIDGSQIYGIDSSRSQQLRSFTKGQLKTSTGVQSTSMGLTNKPYLPLSTDTCSSSDATSQRPCFLAGEYRTSENLDLVSMHTLFNREHNRIALQLSRINPKWSDDKLYNETRRIVVALYQHIVFNDWLPVITGDNSLKPLTTRAYYSGYDSSINPAISSEFATAAFRFGHSLIRHRLNRYDLDQVKNLNKSINFTDVVFRSDPAYE